MHRISFWVPGMPFSYKLGSRIVCQNRKKLFPTDGNTDYRAFMSWQRTAKMEKVREYGMMISPSALPGYRDSVPVCFVRGDRWPP